MAGTGHRTTGRIAGLDLIRGLAISLVILRHAWPGVFGSAGIVGVVAFFALSGYLITGILLKDVRRLGRVRYGRFYRNRALRLLPPMLALVAVVLIVMMTFNPLRDQDGFWRALIASLTYTVNLPYDHGTRAVSHLWTLATEEQFYIVWPLLLTLAVRWRKLLTMFLVSGGVILVALGVSIAKTSPAVEVVYSLPTSWAVAMLIGASAKVWEEPIRRLLPTATSRATGAGSVIALALIALSLVPEDKSSPATYFIFGPFVAVLSVGLILSWSSWKELPSPLMKPLLAVGTVSYAAYLWNYPIALWLGGGNELSGFEPVMSIVLTLLAAGLSWFCIERPTQRWRSRLDQKRQQSDRPRAQHA